MIGAFWNIRGLNKTGRLDCLKDFIDFNSLDFVGIQETKKDSFHPSFFADIGRNFTWNFLPAVGTAGGILVGIKTHKFDILHWELNHYCVSVRVKNSCDDFIWRLVTVYGSAYDEHKQEFITELHSVMDNWDGPTLLGRDFNLTRSSADKNNGNINYHWSDSFNDWINHWGLIELKNPTRSYTWTNNQDQPIMALLDRVLATTNFEAKYPHTGVKSTPRLGSDHVPLVINFGISHNLKPYLFRFEKWWFTQDGFDDLVRKNWENPCSTSHPLEVWQCKLRRLRKKLKGWSLNVNAEIKNKKRT